MREAEKERKKFSPEFRSYSTRARKFRKKSKKIQKIKIPHSGIIFSQHGMRLAEKEGKKILLPNFVPTIPELENSKKKKAKNFKKLKMLIPALFLSKTV